MDDHFQMTQDGTEVTRSDLNELGETAGLAGDHVLADLLQWMLGSSTNPQKAVMPSATAMNPLSPSGFLGLVQPTGQPDGTIFVSPCRAIVGSRTDPNGVPTVDTYNNIRSGLLIGSGDIRPAQKVQPDATVADNRIDLIYLRIELDLDSAPVSRYLKSATGTESVQAVSVTKTIGVSLGVITGMEAASPTRPSLPADAAPVYYIPLAYVWLTHPFTSGSTILGRMVEDVAPVLGANPGRVGTANAKPISKAGEVGSDLLSNAVRTLAKPPDAWLPEVMAGVVHRFFALDQQDDITIPNGGTIVVLDDSLDWRKRLFWSRAQARNNSNTSVAWDPEVHIGHDAGDAVPADEERAPANNTTETFGQSFAGELVPAYVRCTVIYMDDSNLPLMSGLTYLWVFVDLSDGKLKIEVGGSVDAGVHVFVWIMATGQFVNGGAQL